MQPTSPSFLYKEAPLSSDEAVLGKWYACRTMLGASVHGGQMILTNSRVIFHPINVDLLYKFTKMFSHAKFAVNLLGKALDVTGSIVSIPLDQIERVEPIGQPRLLSPPRVGLTLRDRSYYEFGFGVSFFSPVFLPQNAQVRDDFVQRLQALCRALLPKCRNV